MYSTQGRPRILNDEQLKKFLIWYPKWKALRKLAADIGSIKKFADELGVKDNVIAHAVEIHGRYKQPSPESRNAVAAAKRIKRKRLKDRGWM